MTRGRIHTPLTCEECRASMHDFVMENLGAEMTGRIRGHLKQCQECEEVFADELERALTDGDIAMMEVPESLPPFPAEELFYALKQATYAEPAEVFISYQDEDRAEVMELVKLLEDAGVSLWLDLQKPEAPSGYGLELTRRIEECKAFMLICTEASMRSQEVRREIQIAWQYEKSFLPLLLGYIPQRFQKHVSQWLSSWNGIAVEDQSPEEYMPSIMHALTAVGVKHAYQGDISSQNARETIPARLKAGFHRLVAMAGFTSHLLTVPVPVSGGLESGVRSHQSAEGSEISQHTQVRVLIESDRSGHLLLLSTLPSGETICLCPSRYAPETQIHPGRNYVPQAGSAPDYLDVKPGEETLLAVISDMPLGFHWMPVDVSDRTQRLGSEDMEALMAKLRELDPGGWSVLSTSFDVAEG